MTSSVKLVLAVPAEVITVKVYTPACSVVMACVKIMEELVMVAPGG